MKKVLLASVALCAALFANECKPNDCLVIQMEQLGEKGNVNVGEVTAINTAYGVAFLPNLKGLTAGAHGFHVHMNADCGATEKGLGMKAGGHWDPTNAGKHSFAWDDNGHKGDLPALFVDSEGNAVYPVLAPKIKDVSELKGHALMIHVGGDNHSDHPKPLGGGGARMVCGVIK
ncbi:superoxide dismutase family protein [Campylobacter gastrosuis]|uniref:Superoxide dismutase [Cu-Zn] n=1 Tax=Campylobacter gastrosuis TaxID=2974576 RepID=A0ABT7HN85_9BACT|nr:superoxide dismutase family protein [Campylobacter gastrosuis]MDL0088363.1 superoxide dismutase family protein [Campylobacter gastrosuis]